MPGGRNSNSNRNICQQLLRDLIVAVLAHDRFFEALEEANCDGNGGLKLVLFKQAVVIVRTVRLTPSKPAMIVMLAKDFWLSA